MGNKKTVLIIGGSSEIAQAIIRRLGKFDYNVLTTGRETVNCDYHLDLLDNESISKFEYKINNVPIDWVLYCAGFIKPNENLERFNSEYGKQSMIINCTAAIHILSELEPNISPGGGIICLSSTAGIWGNSNFPIYSTWKGALNTFLQSYKVKIGMRGKHVFSICPGPTNTRMRQAIAGDAEKHQDSSAVADSIVDVIYNPDTYSDSTILVVRNNTLSRLNQELVSYIK